ncbi:MAG: LD-carboxypeptidase, partial [Sphingomonadales bacterium]
MLGRRTVLGGLGAAAIAPTAGLPAVGAASAIRPPRLREGDTVGLICPAGFVADRFGVEQVSDTIRAMGLVPKAAPHLLARHGYLAGSDEQRASDIQAMFADETVRAIFAVRGGWGCQRL